MKSGTHTLSGNLNSLATTLALDTAFRIHLRVPTLSSSGTSVTTTYINKEFNISLNTGAPFSYTWDPSNATGFDIGWAKLEAGANGRVFVGHSGGVFTLGVNDWDIFLFGTKFNDALDFSLGTNGLIAFNLPRATFDMGSGTNWIRVDTNTTFPFSLNLVSGVVDMDFPDTGLLTLPGFSGLVSGTLKTGMDLWNALNPAANTGTFDNSFNRTIRINGVNFGSIGVRFWRSALNGPVNFTASSTLGNDLVTAELDIDVSTAGNSRLRMTGSARVPNLFGPWLSLDGPDLGRYDGYIELGDLSLNVSSVPGEQFRGSGTILGSKYDVVLGTDRSYIDGVLFGWNDLAIPFLLPE